MGLLSITELKPNKATTLISFQSTLKLCCFMLFLPNVILLNVAAPKEAMGDESEVKSIQKVRKSFEKYKPWLVPVPTALRPPSVNVIKLFFFVTDEEAL